MCYKIIGTGHELRSTGCCISVALFLVPVPHGFLFDIKFDMLMFCALINQFSVSAIFGTSILSSCELCRSLPSHARLTTKESKQ